MAAGLFLRGVGLGADRCVHLVQFEQREPVSVGEDDGEIFPKTSAWQFWFVSHVYTNWFFVPIQCAVHASDAASHSPLVCATPKSKLKSLP
jgi:hypothetical protein